MTMSTERASIMWRKGTMPQTYSPPATGVLSAAVTRARPAKSSAAVTSSSQNRPTSSTRLPMSIACSGRQRWLMSHISLMSGPIASRTTRTRRDFLGRRRIAGQRHLGLHLAKTLLQQDPRGALRLVVGEPAPQRAGGIGRHPVAMAAEQLPERLVERLALDVPQRDVDGRQRQGEDAARPAGIAGAGAQLGDDLLDAQRILADGERRQFVDGGRAGCRSSCRHRA